MNHPARVGYWGPQWSFTYLAARRLFPTDELLAYGTPRETFRALDADQVDVAILPVQNSTVGAVTETLQLLAEQTRDTRIRIVDELYLPVHHFLMARSQDVSLQQVEAILTIPIARDQCELWLDRHLPSAAFVGMRTTADAAAKLGEWCQENGKEAAAIGPREVADHHGLPIIAANIEDQKNNTTRFLALSKRAASGGGATTRKVTVVTILHDRPGSLATVFGFLAARKMNVSGVKMTPVRAPAIMDWKDWIFLDLEVPSTEAELREALRELTRSESVFVLKVLGIYPDRSPSDDDRLASLFGDSSVDFTNTPGPEPGVQQIVARGESDQVEFKSSMRWDYREGKLNRDLEQVVAKEVAGFMNTKGGLLLIGVADDGLILGLGPELETMSQKTTDAYYRTLVQVTENYLGKEQCPLIRATFEELDGKVICAVRIEKSPRPVYCRKGEKVEFYVRMGNTTRGLNVQEATSYIAGNWRP